MGKSDEYLYQFYSQKITPNIKGDVALLGFTNNNWFQGDLYDPQLGNWEINSEWKLKKKYDTIICLRCPYFSKYPEDFIARCYSYMNNGGHIFAEWGLGDHWRFKDFKVGWIKDNKQEYAYEEGLINIDFTVTAELGKEHSEVVNEAERHLQRNFKMPDAEEEIDISKIYRILNSSAGVVNVTNVSVKRQKPNYLWSTVWDDSFKNVLAYQKFEEAVGKFGYDDVEQAIKDEVPKIMDLDYINKYFDVRCDLLMVKWGDMPQLYILFSGVKK